MAICSGFETREALIWFDEKRMVMTFERNEDMMDSDDVCDRENIRYKFDPWRAFHKNETKKKVQELIS